MAMDAVDGDVYEARLLDVFTHVRAVHRQPNDYADNADNDAAVAGNDDGDDDNDDDDEFVFWHAVHSCLDCITKELWATKLTLLCHPPAQQNLCSTPGLLGIKN